MGKQQAGGGSGVIPGRPALVVCPLIGRDEHINDKL